MYQRPNQLGPLLNNLYALHVDDVMLRVLILTRIIVRCNIEQTVRV